MGLRRIGGELPLNADRICDRRTWQSNWLAFSNGRAALAWLLDDKRTRSVSVCAYTCPKLVAFLRRRDLDVRLYDVGEEPPNAHRVIVPALFGSPPWSDKHAFTIIDAAQTAFGHMDFPIPEGGAVLSCPRKCTGLVDGAVLAMQTVFAERGSAYPSAVAEAAAMKAVARALWAGVGPEDWAVWWNEHAEARWPETPHAMTCGSRVLLERLDFQWHKYRRLQNSGVLATALGGGLAFPQWKHAHAMNDHTPFSLPIFVGNPGEVITKLKDERIYLTRLWPNTSHDPHIHKAASYMANFLVSLPVDQRHDPDDMKRLAEAVLRVAVPPPILPPPNLVGMLA
jgi:hypothetical protein